jgi:2,3-bisphosphoglycerate-independent phosphoglycerate mutase
MGLEFLQKLAIPGKSKIVMLIMDGLGGLPLETGGKTELETACTPNLDNLAVQSALGLTIPVAPGITPGSGPGHLAIFGYDPIQYEIGRGAMEALGVDFELRPGDVAARGNFCTIDRSGLITDRRAGRIPNETSLELIHRLRTIQLDGIEIFIELVKEHRFALIFRGAGLNDALTETDPQKTGVPALQVYSTNPNSEKTAWIANQFINQAHSLLTGQQPANSILLRGFARLPLLPKFTELYGLRAAAVALSGMYRGVARLVGMEVLDVVGNSIADEFSVLENHWDEYEFFYLHVKKTDTCGENGDFTGKVKAIEEVDGLIPRLLALKPDGIIIGGDHSSPAVLKAHSWHPVPTLIYGKFVRADGITKFGECNCTHGSLGIIPAMSVMPIVMANAGRLAKYGA